MKKQVIMYMLLPVLLFWMCSHLAYGADVTISYIPPETNSDGTSLTDLAGHKVYWGYKSGQYKNSEDVGMSTTHKFQVPDNGLTHYVAVTAYDTSGNESEFSEEVHFTTILSKWWKVWWWKFWWWNR